MKEKIERLSRCEFIYELPKIVLSAEELLITIESGGSFKGEFMISNSVNSRMKGVLYSSCKSFIIEDDKFIGEENKIHYHVTGEYLEPGEKIKGNVSIVSDCGELLLPFQIHVLEQGISSSIGQIKDMFQFTNLASEDWAQAKQLFKSGELSKIMKHRDGRQMLIYKTLQKGSGMSQAMDEFLIGARKKSEVKITADKVHFSYEASKYNFMDKVVLTKEGWGYSQIRISSTADFIVPERKIVWADNFDGNTYQVNFVIQVENMKDGIHCGQILIETIHQTIPILITVSCSRGMVEKRLEHRKKQQYELKLVQNYLDFRFNRRNASKYAAEAEGLLTINEREKSFLLSLYSVHVEMVSGKESKAREDLREIEERLYQNHHMTSVENGIYLYVRALLGKGAVDIKETTERIREIYQKESDAWILLWCIHYLDKSYDFNKQKKYDEMKEQCIRGCNSPVMYYEAAYLMNENPALLKSLDAFELRVLAFAVRNRFVNKDLGRAVSYLAVRSKGRESLLIWILKKIYEQYKIKETLTAICTILIRERRMDSKAFDWYKHGIEEQLRITELPEYYIYSMGKDEAEINHSILTYFTYNNKLPDRKKAILFAKIIERKEKEPAVYRAYEQGMKEFVLQKLSMGTINEEMGILYDDILYSIPLDEKIAAWIPEVAFYYCLKCQNKNMKNVIVVHKELMNETVIPLNDGKAYIELYTDNTEIFLADEKNHRYDVTIPYTLEKMVHLDFLLEKCYELNVKNPKLLIHLSDKVQAYQKFDDSAIQLRSQVALLPEISEERKQEYIKTLIFYFYENCEGELLESYLSFIDLHQLDQASRNKIIEIMILRDLYNPVLMALVEFGYENIEVKRLLKLCSRIIKNLGEDLEKIDILRDICHYVFERGKYDEAVLDYLVTYFYGTTKEMYELWKAAKNFDVDTMELEDRLLAQMLFAESYLGNAVPVFMSYYRSGYNRKLIRAFLSYYSYKYLIKDRLPEPELFDVMKREAGYDKNNICLLALLKYYSTKESLTDSEINFVDYYMNEFELKNIVLPFFKDFKQNMHIPQRMNDKFYVEYRTNPENKVMIHYCIDGNDNGDYKTEEMKNVCYGIFVKEFVLFNNESFQYYISEENGENSVITESMNEIIPSDEISAEENKYHNLNLILAARDMKDEVTVNKLLDQYVRVNYGIEKLFRRIE